MKRVTVQMIADALGVSKGLVSRALTGKFNVSNEMRNTIIEKAIELGYDFGNLRTKRKRCSILLITTGTMLLAEDFWQPIIRSIADTLNEHNINLEYFTYAEDAPLAQQTQDLVQADLKGYIFIHNAPEGLLGTVEKTGNPVVIVDPRRLEMGKHLRVKYSNHDSAYQLTEHLISLGHRHLCFYGSQTLSLSFSERCQGFDSCIAMHSADKVCGYHVFFDNLYGDYADNQRFETFLREHPQVTAIVCANDIVAYNAEKSILRLGMRVPEDYSLTGFDNLTRNRAPAPTLTTVNVPRKEIGEVAARYLIDRINKKSIGYSQIMLDCELVIGNSTAKPKNN